MIRIRDIDHLVLRVTNLDAMLAFYCGTLGCSVERRRDDLGLVQLRAGRALIDLVPVSGKLGSAGGAAPGAEGRNLDHFCLRIEDYDEAAIRHELAAAGVAIGEAGTRYGAEGDGASLYVTDPEGNTVELKGPPSAADAKQPGEQDALAPLVADIEALLVAARAALDAEIRDYPTPIPRCDAQFNSLYEQRARIARELAAIGAATSERSSASYRKVVDDFVRAGAFSDLPAEAALRERAAALGKW
jgi:catechol 2,3-dioxygenase-like lactoylglutathione lyase family enzyme